MPERHTEVERICQAALDRPQAERERFLLEECGSDEQLRYEVERLLSNESAAVAFLETPALAVAAQGLGATGNALTAGQQLGRYVIVSLLGAGGMGRVYRAHDATLGRDVAIKVLPTIFTDDPERLARFEREARLSAALNHPNIATIHGIERLDGIHALILEVVEGDTLADVIAAGRIPVDKALPIARQIADALEAAHEKGIVHRDLKPANIKIRPDGVVKVLDFGLAKASWIGAPTNPGDSQDGMLLGTAPYMSPEQARGFPVDKRADIWAFGCVLYEMLTGRVAFEGATVSDTIVAILERAPDWTALSPSTPASIRRLLQRCLDKDPKRRLHDIADARIEIEDALAGSDTQPKPNLWRQRLRTWSIAIAFAILLAVIAVLAVVSLGRPAVESKVTRLDLVTPDTRDQGSFALSEDGRQLVFAATFEGATRLWVRDLSQPTARPLPDTDGASYPFWAPDGHAIGFFADGKLKRIDVPNGVPKVLADAPTGRGGAWNRDGVILFARLMGPLWRIPADGGTATPATRIEPGHNSHRFPQFLPDGRFLFRVAAPRAARASGTYMASLDGGQPTQILASDSVAVYVPPNWLLVGGRDGGVVARRFDRARGVVSDNAVPVATNVAYDQLGGRNALTAAAGVLAYRSITPQPRQLVWRDRGGRTLKVMALPDPLFFTAPELSPDGHRIAIYKTIEGRRSVWVLDANTGLESRISTGDGAFPIWSGDGSRIAFISNRDNAVGRFYEKAADGSGSESLLLSGSETSGGLSDWSPDGQTILYGLATNGRSAIWALPLTGERKPFLVTRGPVAEGHGQFSRDGRWMVYQSNPSGGRFEIYVRAFPDGTPTPVSVGGGTQPRWRRDGKELFYVAPDGRLMAVPIALGTKSLEVGAPVALFDAHLGIGANAVVSDNNLGPQYSVTPDGRFLLNTPAEQSMTLPITVVLNWDADLTR